MLRARMWETIDWRVQRQYHKPGYQVFRQEILINSHHIIPLGYSLNGFLIKDRG